MSKLCVYEFEHIACDRFFLSHDDHMVPTPGSPKLDDCFVLKENLNANICGLTSSCSNTSNRSSTRCRDQGREQKAFSIPRRRKAITENDSWPVNSLFSSACDSIPAKNSSSLALDSTESWNTNNTCSDDQNSRELDFLKDGPSSGSRDFLGCDSWSAMKNFEDIETMLSEKDEFSWLPSADDSGASGDLLKSSVTFTCPETYTTEESHDSLRSSSINDTFMITPSIISEEFPFPIQSAAADKEDRFVPLEQLNKKKSYFGNSSSTNINELPNEVPLLPARSIYHHPFSSPQSSECPNNVRLVPLPQGNSFSSSKYPPSSHDPPGARAIAVPEQGQERQGCEGSRCSVTRSLKTGSEKISSPDRISKYFEHGKRRGVARAGLCTSNVKESSTASSGTNNVSQEAASFLQLQLVMEQLDFRTKLGIRDSLYRLADSADRRNTRTNEGKPNSNEGTKERRGCMEADRNSMDRSMADLLFHRASYNSFPANLFQVP
ncbi:protein LNK1-like isoform X2 [Andrographis paniculata]|uniref:protein LNK1-like isoform X2 n=1 Tax=Andrographis paniculata TaxID=175694 RepID=UPI0021E79316|nr:protein LNK1-like isoform X2 [Andrographis paniculata]